MHGYLRHLANFARIVEAGSMKAASEVIGVSPSGLSDSVRMLETRLGSPLLIRHSQGVTPTSEGERVYAAAAGIVDLLHEAIGPEDATAFSGTCRMSVPTEVANTCIGRIIAYFKALHPNVELKMYAEDEVLDHSRFGRDYFLRIARRLAAQDGLRTIWTGTAHAILVASATRVPMGSVNDLELLSALPVISGVDRKAPISFPLTDPKGRLTVKEVLGVSHPSAQLILAEQGHGFTGSLDFCAAGAIGRGTLRQLLPERFSVPLDVHLLTPHRRKRPLDTAMIAAVKKLLDPAVSA